MAVVYKLVPRTTLEKLMKCQPPAQKLEDRLLEATEERMKKLRRTIPKVNRATRRAMYQDEEQRFIRLKRGMNRPTAEPSRTLAMTETQTDDVEDEEEAYDEEEYEDEEDESEHDSFKSPEVKTPAVPLPKLEFEPKKTTPPKPKVSPPKKTPTPKASPPAPVLAPKKQYDLRDKVMPSEKLVLDTYTRKLLGHIQQNPGVYKPILHGKSMLRLENSSSPIKNSDLDAAAMRLVAGAMRKSHLAESPPGYKLLQKYVNKDVDALDLLDEVAGHQKGKGRKPVTKQRARIEVPKQRKPVAPQPRKRGRPRERFAPDAPFRAVLWRTPHR